MSEIPSLSTLILYSFKINVDGSFFMWLISILFIFVLYFLYKKNTPKVDFLSELILYISFIASTYGLILNFSAASSLDFPPDEFIKFAFAGIAASIIPIFYTLYLLFILKIVKLFNFKILTQTL
jgi:hypothetical protein